MSIASEMKELANQLVGTWYCDDINECFTFHLNEAFLKTESRLTIINKLTKYKPSDTVYGIGIYPGGAIEEKTKFYIDIGPFEKRYYLVENITKYKLDLREYWMMPDVPPSVNIRAYKRITDVSAADDILKGLDLGE